MSSNRGLRYPTSRDLDDVASDGLVTYADAARWLPTDVRERIDATRPCRDGGTHDWEHHAIDVTELSSPFARRIESWLCNRCRTAVSADPEQTA